MSDIKTINCEKAIRHLLEYLDREVNDELKTQMEHHLSSCRGCYSRMEFEKTLKSRIRDAGPEAAPDALRERINGLLKDFGQN